MAVTGQPPPGGGPGHGSESVPHPQTQYQVKPGQTFAGAAMAASGTVPGGRSWQQIFNDAKQKRNILEIHIEKNNTPTETQEQPSQRYLTTDQL